VLYDLLNGCDLTRIDYVSWQDWEEVKKDEEAKKINWHRRYARSDVTPMQWGTFEKLVVQQALPDDTTLTNFVVGFSGPVKVATLRRDIISITALVVEEDTGWLIPLRFPISDLDTTPSGKRTLPSGMTDQFRVKVASGWVNAALLGQHSILKGEEDNFVIEIQIHGDLVIDCNGQAVDGNTSGLQATPTGNGTPGGSYLSSFEVVAKPRSKVRSAR
jgi:hypothetical protein